MLKFTRFITITILIITIFVFSYFQDTDTKITIEGKKELCELLEIENAPSFKFIYIKNVHFYNDGPELELKFQISKDDYEKNKLKFLKTEKGNIYTCVIQASKNSEPDRILYKELKRIKHAYGYNFVKLR